MKAFRNIGKPVLSALIFLLIFPEMSCMMFLDMTGGEKMMDCVRVVVDAMGGDHAPEEPIKGAVAALVELSLIHI